MTESKAAAGKEKSVCVDEEGQLDRTGVQEPVSRNV